jgi:hypothetical protein
MLTRTLSCLVACLALLGCASQPDGMRGPPRLPQACDTPACAVLVSVYGNCSNPDNILATPDKAPIKRGNSDARIEWTIADSASAYTFAANGIDFHGDPQFHNPQRLGTKKFQWFDTNSDALPHKYSINLLRDGVACPPLDPGIINGQ